MTIRYDECKDDDFEELLCSDEGEGEPVVNRLRDLVAIDDDQELNGTNTTSRRLSNGWGGAFQATIAKPFFGLSFR